MSRGKEMMKQVQEVLAGFEEAIVRREKKGILGILESKVSLQQGVDKARERVVEVVVALVRANEGKKH